MPATEIDCPICEGNIPLHGDEVAGEEVFCGYCGVKSALTKKILKGDEEEFEIEPDI